MTMNELIASARPRRSVGLIDRLKASAPLEPSRAERFRELVNQHEAAVRRGSVEEAAALDHALDRLFVESRESRKAEDASVSTVETPAVESKPEPISFDAGVRRPIPRPKKPMGLLDVVRAEIEAQREIRQRALERQEAARR